MNQQFVKKEIALKTEDFSQWYNDVVLKAELADYSPVKGCMVIRPNGYALWENIQQQLDKMIKSAGVNNAYFPLFIPESFLKKEKEHVKGFSPELAVVTIGGGKKLAEPVVIRPTSETIMYYMFAKWIHSWRDLPLLINQWCNIVRWEKRTYLFLRTSEFLWQEGHTCHATHREAEQEVKRAIEMYVNFYRDYLAIDGYVGKKSEREKFPGAVDTFTYEMLMPDGKVLQGCTAHDLGQNFARPFNVQFQDKDGKMKFVWQTSWGLSSRSIGALIMAHGDNQGLILPPRIAPIQVVIIPIIKQQSALSSSNNELQNKMKKYVYQVEQDLKNKNIRIKTDWRDQMSIGRKFNEWELKGIPLRIEIGEKEIDQQEITLARRDNKAKQKIKINDLVKTVESNLLEIQNNLLIQSRKFLKEHTYQVDKYQEFKQIMNDKRGFISAYWCGNSKCEEKIKKETKASTRCLSADQKNKMGKCIYCGKSTNQRWLFAQSY